MRQFAVFCIVLGMSAGRATTAAADTIITQLDQTRFPQYANNATAINISWATPFNVKASNDERATGTLVFFSMSGDGRIDLLDLQDFGFTVPPTATINGIEVIAERQAGAGGVSDRVVLRKPLGMSTWLEIPRNGVGTWPVGTDGLATFGSGVDLWGTTWTPADVNSPEFGAYFSARSAAGGQTVAVDSVRIVVHYTDAITVDPVPAGGIIPAVILMVMIVALCSRLLLRTQHIA